MVWSRKDLRWKMYLREVNAKLKSILPVGCFLLCYSCAHLGFRNRSIEVWAGGLPEGVIYNTSTIKIKTNQIATFTLRYFRTSTI
jgi:hypothetical protein